MAALRANSCLIFSVLLLLCIIQYVLFRVLPGDSASKEIWTGIALSKGTLHNLIKSKVPDGVAIQLENFSKYMIDRVSLQRPSSDRVAVLIPYTGKTLPNWFDAFALSAMGSSSLVDWYIFISEAPRRKVPPNVHLIRISRREIFARLARLDSTYASTRAAYSRLQGYFQHLIDVHPYILVEMKPALGFLFADYISNYTHWAYADLDLLAGRIDHQITPDMLQHYDIITMSFGDNNILYMRGQFTLHKNTPAMLNLWKGCDYLSKIGTRLEKFVEKHKKWDFHSAEGCYSRVVANTPNISVLYIPVQFSDASHVPLEAKETMVLGNTLLRCNAQPITDTVIDAAYHLRPVTHRYFAEKPSNVLTAGAPLSRVQTGTEHCAYWIDPADQVCTETVAANATITIENGEMTSRIGNKKHFAFLLLPFIAFFSLCSHFISILLSIEERFALSHCREASISHFQGWKRGYYTYTTRVPPSNAHAMVITETGIVPLKLSSPGVKEYAETHNNGDVLRAGRLYPAEVLQLSLTTLPTEFSSLASTTRGALSHTNDSSAETPGESLATSYCIRFSDDLKKCTRYLLGAEITLLSAPRRNSFYSRAKLASAVTMISVGWLHEYVTTGAYVPLLSSWDGPKILVLAVMDEEEVKSFNHDRQDVIIIAVNISPPSSSDGSSERESYSFLPEKTLFNIGLDAALTDLVLLTPNNVHFVLHESDNSKKAISKAADEALWEEITAKSTPTQPAALVIPMGMRVYINGMQTRGEYTHAAYPPSRTKASKGKDECGSDQPESLKVHISDVIESGTYPTFQFTAQVKTCVVNSCSIP